MENKGKQPHYGNWVSDQLLKKVLGCLSVLVIIEILLEVGGWGWVPLKAIMAVLIVFLAVCMIYFCYARWLFAPEGRDIQQKVRDLLIDNLAWNGAGKVLDIGCGSGALAIDLAKQYPRAKITGIDYWGDGWDYAQKQCEENAELEGVTDRMEFQRASASQIPFPDDTFDLVVSNLTFHEVKDVENKMEAVKEAVRVVKKGGSFVFQDLFQLKSYYGTPDELIAAVKDMGVKEVSFVDTSTASFIPGALKLPFMIGALGLIHGEK